METDKIRVTVTQGPNCGELKEIVGPEYAGVTFDKIIGYMLNENLHDYNEDEKITCAILKSEYENGRNSNTRVAYLSSVDGQPKIIPPNDPISNYSDALRESEDFFGDCDNKSSLDLIIKKAEEGGSYDLFR